MYMDYYTDSVVFVGIIMSDIVISFCWIGIHSWSKWEDVENKECGNFQVKTCAHCRKKQYTSIIAGHKWSKWSDGDTTSVYTNGEREEKGDYPTYKTLTQRRSCEKCGETKARTIRLT